MTATSAGGSSFTGQGQSLAVAGVIATNRILSSATALIDGANVTTTSGDVAVGATNTSTIEATTLAAMTSGSQAVGVELAFNTIGWKRTNLLFAALDALLGDPLVSSAFGGKQAALTDAKITNSTIDASGDVTVTSTSTAHITAVIDNSATSAPQAIMGAGGMSAAAVLSSNMVNSAAHATIDTNTSVDAGGDVSVSASDDAAIDAHTTLYASVSPTNDAGAGILNKLAGALLGEYQFTSHSGTRLVHFGDKVRTDDGTVYQYMGEDDDAHLDETTQDYTDFGYWKPLSEPNLISASLAYAALSALGTVLKKEGLTGSADSYFGLVDHNDLRSEVRASITDTPVTAGGNVSVSALENASLIAFDDSLVQTWAGLRRSHRHERRAFERGSVDRGAVGDDVRRHRRRRREHLDTRRDGDVQDRGLRQDLRRGRRLQLHRLEVVEHPVQRPRRADRRPADLVGVRRVADAVGRAGVDPRHEARRRWFDQRHR